jgi:hypothetical protein
MKRLLLAAVALIAVVSAAYATTYLDTDGSAVVGHVVVGPGIGPIFTASHPGYTQSADGANVTIGSTSDSSCASISTVCSVESVLRGMWGSIQQGVAAIGSAFPSQAIGFGADSSGNMVGIIQADHSSPINFSSTTAQLLVATSGTKKVYITAWDVMAGGTGSFSIVYGTQTTNPCDTGQTLMAGPYPLVAQAGKSGGSGLGPILIAPAGSQVCAVSTAAVQMSGSYAWTQF